MGPRLKDVEDLMMSSRFHSRESSFNGATSQGRGRRHNFGPIGGCDLASMGPRLKDVEDVLLVSQEIAQMTGFNGATSQGRGRLSGV